MYVARIRRNFRIDFGAEKQPAFLNGYFAMKLRASVAHKDATCPLQKKR